jgi:hypothetical protein
MFSVVRTMIAADKASLAAERENLRVLKKVECAASAGLITGSEKVQVVSACREIVDRSPNDALVSLAVSVLAILGEGRCLAQPCGEK